MTPKEIDERINRLSQGKCIFMQKIFKQVGAEEKQLLTNKTTIMKNRNLAHKDDWATPAYVYNPLNKEFNFDFDPCPYMHDLELWDGLKVDWGRVNFINPPYSRKLKDAFVKKAIKESQKGKICVMLLPVSTSTVLFHDYIQPNAKEIRFLRGRVRFEGVNTKGEFVKNRSGMHDSMIVVFKN